MSNDNQRIIAHSKRADSKAGRDGLETAKILSVYRSIKGKKLECHIKILYFYIVNYSKLTLVLLDKPATKFRGNRISRIICNGTCFQHVFLKFFSGSGFADQTNITEFRKI